MPERFGTSLKMSTSLDHLLTISENRMIEVCLLHLICNTQRFIYEILPNKKLKAMG